MLKRHAGQGYMVALLGAARPLRLEAWYSWCQGMRTGLIDLGLIAGFGGDEVWMDECLRGEWL